MNTSNMPSSDTRTRLTLVLSPRLAEPDRARIKARASLPDSKVAYLEIPSYAHYLGAVRDHVPTEAVVVLSDEREEDFFRESGVPCITVDKAKALLPIPPARLHDVDGMPMVPYPELAKRCRELAAQHYKQPAAEDQRFVDHVRALIQDETPVTFRVDWLVERWGSRPAPGKLAKHLIDLALGRGGETPALLWVHENRILSMGDPRGRELVAAHHPIHALTKIEPLLSGLRRATTGLNPWGTGGTLGLDAERRAFLEETGIDLPLSMADLRRTADPAPPEWAKGIAMRVSADLDEEVRTLVRELRGREPTLSDKSVPSYDRCVKG